MDLTAAERMMIRIALDERSDRLWEAGNHLLANRYGRLCPKFEPVPVDEEAMLKKAYTERGFRLYLDGPGDGCRGARLSVVESSIACEGAHVRICHGTDEHVQLHADAAEAVAQALLEFVAEARAVALTETVYRDDGNHGHEPPTVITSAEAPPPA